MEVQYHARNIRVAPRKMRLVVDKVRHLPASDAIALLPHITKGASVHVRKSLKAAVEAAKDRNLNPETLVIQRIWADEGSAMKRMLFNSRGRSSGIMKKFSHLTIVLKGEEGSVKKQPKRVKATAEETPVVEEK